MTRRDDTKSGIRVHPCDPRDAAFLAILDGLAAKLRQATYTIEVADNRAEMSNMTTHWTDEIEWRDDAERMAFALTLAAQRLIEYRDAADRTASRLTAHAQRMGYPYDKRADTAAGASAAYGIAIATIVGAMRVRSIDDIAGDSREWRTRDMERPVLPDGIGE